jgi:lipoprotein Spr
MAAFLMLGSCKAFKPLQSPARSSQSKSQGPFLDDIKLNTEGRPEKMDDKMPSLVDNYNAPMSFNTGMTIDEAASLQFRYSILLNTEVEYLANLQLYKLIDDWWGTPYRIGGLTKNGVDCSAFVQNLMNAVYEEPLPRTAQEQKALCKEISKEEIKEGDLVFFNTRGGVSHVGVYLHNNKFVHASTSGGVMISDLAEPYWQKRFIAAGRPGKQ